MNISIAISILELTVPSEYNFSDFVNQVEKFFSNIVCPLCGEFHPVSIHDFRVRFFFSASFVSIHITVVRIICYANKALRKSTGKKIKYTLTVLPTFLIPHARITAICLFKAFSRLARTGNPNDAISAVSKAADPRPLMRYLNRFLDRSPKWFVRMWKWIVESGMKLPIPTLGSITRTKKEMPDLWKEFKRNSTLLCEYLEKISPDNVFLRPEQPVFTHARLTFAGMGLGP